MENGGSLYFEGADVTSSAHNNLIEYLGVLQESDGETSGIETISGMNAGFTRYDSYEYPEGTMADYKIDELAEDGGTAFLESQDGKIRGVHYSTNNYRTITVSPFFGSYKDTEIPSTKKSLMARYLNFLMNNQDPKMLKSANEINFLTQYVDYPVSKTLIIQNVSQGLLEIDDVSINGNGFLYSGQSSFSLVNGEYAEIEIFFEAEATGEFAAELQILSNDPDNPEITIPLTATCIEPPSIFLPFEQLNIIGDGNEIIEETLQITNNGNSNLNYLISVEDPEMSNHSRQTIREEEKYLRKGEFDDRVGYRGSGGPDNFGYEWIDSNEENGPVFEYTNIDFVGTLISDWTATGPYNPLDEGMAGPIELGFSFGYYGNDYENIYVNSNGLIGFQPIDEVCFTNMSIPDPDSPNNYIAPFWTDLSGEDGGEVYYLRDDNKFILQFTNWHLYGGSGSFNFQIHLCQNNAIRFYYQEMEGTVNQATVGIENLYGGDGLLVAYNTDYIEDELAIEFAAGPAWLYFDNYCGTVESGSTIELPFYIDPTGMDEGVYTAVIKIDSNDPAANIVEIPVNFEITGDESYQADFSVETSTGDSPLGAAVSLINQANENYSYYANVPEDGSLTIDYIVEGTYDLQIYLEGYEDYLQNDIEFDQDMNFDVTLNTLSTNEEENALKTALLNNYPNPFVMTKNNLNAGTKIEFCLAEKQNVEIEIFNLKGQKIKTLMKQDISKGTHKVNWYGENSQGREVSTGIYLIKMKTTNYSGIQKLLLIK